MSASIELVTSHKGTAHITAEQVRDLLAGFSGDVTGIKIFPDLEDGLEPTITDILEVDIATGQGLAGGYHFQLTDSYKWVLDTDPVGYSRIDVLYLVIYEDTLTNVQTADFAYQKGNAYQNGTTGTVPSAPTGVNVKDAYPFLRADITDGALVTVTPYGTEYLSNATMEAHTFEALNGFRFGIDSNGKYGYYKVGADTVTPFRNPTGNAQAREVLQQKTFSNADNDDVVGTMPNRGAIQSYTSGNGKVTIPEGYHNGAGWISGEQSYNAGVSAAQSQTWSRQFSIAKISYTEDGQTKYLGYRELFYDCRNVIRVKFTRPTPSMLIPVDVSWVKWYNEGGTLLRTDDMFNDGTYKTEHTIEPPSGAKYFVAYFDWRFGDSANQTMLLTYQTKLLR